MPNGKLQQAADIAFAAWGKSRTAKKKRRKAARAVRQAALTRRIRNGPNWLRADGSVDYYAYIASAAWRKRRDRWFAKHGRKCIECGCI